MVAATARLIPPSLHVDALLVGDDGLTIRVFAETPEVRCPLCGEPAERVHSRATRTLADLPWAGAVVRLQVRIRKFLCENPTCPRRIFRERLDEVAAVATRRTERQRAALLSPQPPLWTSGEDEWLPVLRLPAYAPRTSRPPGAVQPPLFALEEVSA